MASQQLGYGKERTATDIFRKAFKAPFLRAGAKPFIKHVNWFTGVGKTHGSSTFAVELFLNADAIPVFIAPLQSLVSDFASHVAKQVSDKSYEDELRKLIEENGAHVPVYRICSEEFHFSDRTFFDSAMALARFVQSKPGLQNDLCSVPGASDADGLRKDILTILQKGKLCLTSEHQRLDNDDEDFDRLKEAFDEAAGKVLSRSNSIVRRLILLEYRRRGDPGPLGLMPAATRHGNLLQVPQIADMCRRLYPLQCFLDDPGIIVTTAAKAQTQHHVFVTDAETGKQKWKPYQTLFEFLRDINDDGSVIGRAASCRRDRPPPKYGSRVMLFIDEEEDSYWQAFEQRLSILNKGGRNDLNRVIKEFVDYFDIAWPLGFMKEQDPHLGPKVLEQVELFAAISEEVHKSITREMSAHGLNFLPVKRRTEIFIQTFKSRYPDKAQWWKSDADLAEVATNLYHEGGDAHSEFKRFRHKAEVIRRFREFLWDTLPDEMGPLFDKYLRLMKLVADKKFFLMERVSYGEALDQPHQTFFTDAGAVMSTDFLRQVELVPATGRQTVRLIYHDGEVPAAAFTLLHYLRLVLFIADVLTGGAKPFKMSQDDQKRYPMLASFKREATALFKARLAEQAIEEQPDSNDLLEESFFFGTLKSIVTLEESAQQAEEYNRDSDICLTVTVTSLQMTPEADISTALGTSNGVYLMSATGAIAAASSGAFNMRELGRIVEEKEGLHERMTEEELDFVQARALELHEKRQREVRIFDDEEIFASVGAAAPFEALCRAVESQLEEDSDVSIPNVYKRQEIRGLLATLDRLMSTPARSALAICQTTQRMRAALEKLARPGGRLAPRGESFVSQLDHTGNVFEIDPRYLPGYAKLGQTNKITLVLYVAGRFRKTSPDKVGYDEDPTDPGQFNEELTRALNISEGNKLALWSAYGSAARGVNFLTTDNGIERDFEVLALVNDPFYTRHTRTGQRGFKMHTLQSFAQVTYDTDESWRNCTVRDFLSRYVRRHWSALQSEHYIDIVRTLFQGIGRSERRATVQMDKPQLILLSAGAARSLTLGMRHASELSKRASAAQRAVLEALQAHNEGQALFADPDARRRHELESLKLYRGFRDFTARVPACMRSDPAARSLWAKLFDHLMFSRPEEYLEKLREGGVPEAFWRAAFHVVPTRSTLYVREVDAAEIKTRIITDAIDGTAPYEWSAMLAPQGMVNVMSSKSCSLIKAVRHGVKLTAEGQTKMRLVPQPWFVVEIMKGYIGETEFESFMSTHIRGAMSKTDLFDDELELRLVDTADLPNIAEMYQLYDYFFNAPDGGLVAVDVKNWTQISDQYLGDELRVTAETKFAKLRALFPDRHIRAVYVNLEGNQKCVGQRLDNGEIRYASLFVRTEARGFNPWHINTHLVGLLTGTR